MAIGWITVLKAVPWTDVISNAPKVADGAKKLWKNVAGKTASPAAPGTKVSPEAAAESLTREALAEKFQMMEARTAELQAQMLASSELINALAEQNAELVKRIETIRRRVLWLGAATIGLGILAITGFLGSAAMH